eukprot:360262-Chlamydomonas_euryale.AAC.5
MEDTITRRGGSLLRSQQRLAADDTGTARERPRCLTSARSTAHSRDWNTNREGVGKRVASWMQQLAH